MSNSEELWQALAPSITASGEHRLSVLSTPRGKSGLFHRLWLQADRKRWSRHKVTIDDAIAGGCTVDREDLRAAIADETTWRACYLCEFVDEQYRLSERMQKQYGSKVEPVTFSVPVKENLAARMLRVFQRGELAIPNDDALLNDLHSVEKQVTTAGNVRYAAPRSEGSHADRFMALALALHAGDSGFGEFAYAIAGCDDDEDSWEDNMPWTPIGPSFRRW